MKFSIFLWMRNPFYPKFRRRKKTGCDLIVETTTTSFWLYFNKDACGMISGMCLKRSKTTRLIYLNNTMWLDLFFFASWINSVKTKKKHNFLDLSRTLITSHLFSLVFSGLWFGNSKLTLRFINNCIGVRNNTKQKNKLHLFRST